MLLLDVNPGKSEVTLKWNSLKVPFGKTVKLHSEIGISIFPKVKKNQLESLQRQISDLNSWRSIGVSKAAVIK